jgi:dUTP pyrophosphatase
MVTLVNHGREAYRVTRGDRIAQLVLAPGTRAEIALVEDLGATDRGAGGFGSTGR